MNSVTEQGDEKKQPNGFGLGDSTLLVAATVGFFYLYGVKFWAAACSRVGLTAREIQLENYDFLVVSFDAMAPIFAVLCSYFSLRGIKTASKWVIRSITLGMVVVVLAEGYFTDIACAAWLGGAYLGCFAAMWFYWEIYRDNPGIERALVILAQLFLVVGLFGIYATAKGRHFADYTRKEGKLRIEFSGYKNLPSDLAGRPLVLIFQLEGRSVVLDPTDVKKCIVITNEADGVVRRWREE